MCTLIGNKERKGRAKALPVYYMGLYLDNGYINFDYIVNPKYPFTFIIGGRGTGKTYGAIQYMLANDLPFMFMRRTQSQADLIEKPDFSPFTPVCNDNNYDVKIEQISKYNAGIYEADEEGNPGRILAYTCALSTMSNMRGFSASNLKAIVYDEFIPESHERPIKNEGAALLNAYETINRNRELQGESPVMLLCLSNSNTITSPVFIELKMIKIVASLIQHGQEVYRDPEKGLQIIYIMHSAISNQKSKTALYRLAGESAFSRMSLSNIFDDYDTSNVLSRPIREYRPLVSIGEITIYRHKTGGLYYVTGHKEGSPKEYQPTKTDLKSFITDYWYLPAARIRGKVCFETITDKIIFDKYCHLT